MVHQWLRHRVVFHSQVPATNCRCRHKFTAMADTHIPNLEAQTTKTTDLSTGFSVSPLRAFGENFACYFVQRKLPEIFQTTTIAEFQSTFEEVINNETWISEPLQISLFISGLKPELRLKLLFNRPSSLMEAYSLARAYEARMDETQNSSSSDVLNNASAISTDTQSMNIEETRLEAKPGLSEGIEWVASSETQSFTIKTPLGRTIATDAFNLNALVGYFSKCQRSWGEVVVQKLRVLLIREHSHNSIEWGTAERFKVGNGLIRGNLVSDPLISTWWVFDKGKSIHSWYLHQVDNDLGILMPEISAFFRYQIPQNGVDKLVSSANKLFDEMPYGNIATWDACILKANLRSISWEDTSKFVQLIGVVVQLHGNVILASTLIDTFGRCQLIEELCVFEEMSVLLNTVILLISNQIVINRLVLSKSDKEAIKWILRTEKEGIQLFNMTPIAVFFACLHLVNICVVHMGYSDFGNAGASRCLIDAIPLRNKVKGYAKTSDMAVARSLFDELLQRDFVFWSALMLGHVQKGKPREAVKGERRNVSMESLCNLHGWGIREYSRHVYDVVLFSNTVDILEIRWKELYPYVREFVLLPLNSMFTSLGKPFGFSSVRNQVNFVEPQLTYGQVPGRFKRGENPFIEEANQRLALDYLLKQVGIQDDNLLIMTDVDEIPSRLTINIWRWCGGIFPIFYLCQKNYLYSFESLLDNNSWRASDHIYQASETRYAHYRQIEEILADAGWHFSCCFRHINEFTFKMKVYGHVDLVKFSYFRNLERNQKVICKGVDLFDMLHEEYTFREIIGKQGPIPYSHTFVHLPGYLLENAHQHKFLLPGGIKVKEFKIKEGKEFLFKHLMGFLNDHLSNFQKFDMVVHDHECMNGFFGSLKFTQGEVLPNFHLEDKVVHKSGGMIRTYPT